MMKQKNEDFINFIINEDNKSFDARMHRMLFREEFLCWLRYLDLKRRELRVCYYRTIGTNWMEHKMGRLDMSKNLHHLCFNDIIAEMMSYKKEQIKKRKEQEAKKKQLATFLTQ